MCKYTANEDEVGGGKRSGGSSASWSKERCAKVTRVVSFGKVMAPVPVPIITDQWQSGLG